MTKTNPTQAQAHVNRPRAVASGVIFGGVDCYVFDDGSTALSQSGMVRGLRGKTDVHDSANLNQYLARLPEKYSALATCTNFEFVRPDGGIAIGRPARDFVAMCRAYAEMYAGGDIHKARVPIARNCIAILSHLADRGIDEIIYEAANWHPRAVSPANDSATAVARLTETIEALYARIVALEARRAANEDRPSIGDGGAKVHVLGPLMEIATIEARVSGRDRDKRAVSRLRTIADTALRERLDYPRGGGKWQAFPRARIGDLHCALLRMFHEARRRANILQPTPTQLRLIKQA